MTHLDDRGDEIAVGDRVFATCIDRGVPAWAGKGTVVGLALTRIRIQWDQYGYDEAQPYHVASASSVRRMDGIPTATPNYYEGGVR